MNGRAAAQLCLLLPLQAAGLDLRGHVRGLCPVREAFRVLLALLCDGSLVQEYERLIEALGPRLVHVGCCCSLLCVCVCVCVCAH